MISSLSDEVWNNERDKSNFRIKLTDMTLANIIDKDMYNKLRGLTVSGQEEDFELAKQILRAILINS